jgi:hypothetical protein
VRGDGAQAFARNRGKPIDLQTRQNVAMLLLLGELSYRSIAKQCRVSLGSITNIKKRIVQLMPNRRKMPSLQMIADALRDRKRCGGAAKRRKIGRATRTPRFSANCSRRTKHDCK